MADGITEALLEMHYHRAIVKHFENTFGARFLRLLKPSARAEAWLGFDQGWVRITVTDEEFRIQLREAIQVSTTNVGPSSATSVSGFYLGYFMQFKCVESLTRRTKYAPSHYASHWFRVELSLTPNETTGLSQHETLRRLTNINMATVCYACPMMFLSDEIYDEPNLDRLHCVDVASSPDGWLPTERHFLTFQDERDTAPYWFSTPIRAKSVAFKVWATPGSNLGPNKMQGNEISEIIDISSKITERKNLLPNDMPPESFTVIEFESRLQDETVLPHGSS